MLSFIVVYFKFNLILDYILAKIEAKLKKFDKRNSIIRYFNVKTKNLNTEDLEVLRLKSM